MQLKERDLYNFKADTRTLALRGNTPIQALLQELEQSNEFYSEKLWDENDKLIGLFFCHTSSQHLLRFNCEILIMDSTYKTNRFRIPLFNIIGINCLQYTFYAGFCFLAQED